MAAEPIGLARCRRRRPMGLENKQRPPWLNWLFLLIFLWSSWQLAGFWFDRLH